MDAPRPIGSHNIVSRFLGGSVRRGSPRTGSVAFGLPAPYEMISRGRWRDRVTATPPHRGNRSVKVRRQCPCGLCGAVTARPLAIRTLAGATRCVRWCPFADHRTPERKKRKSERPVARHLPSTTSAYVLRLSSSEVLIPKIIPSRLAKSYLSFLDCSDEKSSKLRGQYQSVFLFVFPDLPIS